MTKILKKHTILLWYLISLIFTGLLLLPHMLWPQAGDYSISFTQLGPMLGTLLIIGITHDRQASARIKDGLRFHGNAVIWCVLSAMAPLILTGISAVFLTKIFNEPHQPWEGNLFLYAGSFIAMLVGSMGEEIGWRGYLLPALNKSFTPLVSSIIVGGLWGFWHLNYAADPVFWLLFMVTTVELSIMLTFLMRKSRGSLWTSFIFHTSFNFANRIFIWERFHVTLLLIEIVVFGIACAACILSEKEAFLKNRAFA